MIFADYVGEVVVHCHFLKHEDLGMPVRFHAALRDPTSHAFA